MRSYCSICLDNHGVESFRFLPCGHGFCAQSLDDYSRRIAARGKPCPICRVPFRSGDARAIYLVADDGPSQAGPSRVTDTSGVVSSDGGYTEVRYAKTALRQATYVAKKIDKVDMKESAESADRIRDVGRHIRLVGQGMEEPGDNVEALLSAMAGFCDRLAPVLKNVAERDNEIAVLTRRVENSSKETQELRDNYERAERLLQKALDTTEMASVELAKSRTENSKLVQRIEDDVDMRSKLLDEKTQEIRRLKDFLFEYKKKEREQNTAIKSLKAQLEKQEHKLANLTKPPEPPVRSRLNSSWCHTAGPRACTYSQSSEDSVLEIEFPDENTAPVPKSQRDSDNIDFESSETHPLPSLFPDPSKVKAVAPQRPQFKSDWNLPAQDKTKRKRQDAASTFPIELDGRGRLARPAQLGSVQRRRF